MDEQEMMDATNWEMEEAVLHQPQKAARSVVSVSFSQEDLATVAHAARAHGMKTSEFIRHAALSEASRKQKSALSAFSAGASQGVSTVLVTNWRRGGRARVIVRSEAGSTHPAPAPRPKGSGATKRAIE